MSAIPMRTPEEEKAYWEREMRRGEAENKRDAAVQALSNARSELLRQTVRTSQAIDVTIGIIILAIIAVMVMLLVKLGIYISGLF